eukprot:TRINITY_DN2500_c1_g1_i1.p1 TRINITY_DN2500_c1_g1~~TRINITY_DN2500_c1_g1_i1.p1  ORF type:complete len:181 (+),score=7.30 TRINITY_DN2500_c1_g1_i1:516-1058(+)
MCVTSLWLLFLLFTGTQQLSQDSGGEISHFVVNPIVNFSQCDQQNQTITVYLQCQQVLQLHRASILSNNQLKLQHITATLANNQFQLQHIAATLANIQFLLLRRGSRLQDYQNSLLIRQDSIISRQEALTSQQEANAKKEKDKKEQQEADAQRTRQASASSVLILWPLIALLSISRILVH